MQSHHQKSTKDHSSCSKDAHKLVTQVIKYVLVQIEHFQYCEELSVAKNPSLEHLAQAASTQSLSYSNHADNHQLHPLQVACYSSQLVSWFQFLAVVGLFTCLICLIIYHKCSSGQSRQYYNHTKYLCLKEIMSTSLVLLSRGALSGHKMNRRKAMRAQWNLQGELMSWNGSACTSQLHKPGTCAPCMNRQPPWGLLCQHGSGQC